MGRYLFHIITEIIDFIIWGWPILLFLALYIAKRRREKKLNHAVATISAQKGLSVSKTEIATTKQYHYAITIDYAAHKVLLMVLKAKNFALIKDVVVDFESTHFLSNLDLYDKKRNNISPMCLLVNEKENKLLLVSFFKNDCVAKILEFSEVLSVEAIKDSKTVTVGNMSHAGVQVDRFVLGSSGFSAVTENVTLSLQLKVITRIISVPYFIFDIYSKSYKYSAMNSEMRARATEILSILSIIVDRGNRML
jgi:hypothetical protein